MRGFLVNHYKIEVIESIKVICLLTIMLMYLLMPLGITVISTLKLFNSLKIVCPSYPSKL